ncbi:hypothetical protein L6452_02128 [Arctium lappa]|uniref:Uncharacterized protein n=1 Tax=Arctium lappa TaxID=4217 RepID=A0ACB9FI11_ARCLA|nr:hypothetical protein L6452_02128 [Arctium lappa]
MKAEQRPWKVHLQAKANNFDLKFKAIKYLPTCCNFFQFSLFLKISTLLIRVHSDNNRTSRSKSLKSKIIGVIKKFRSRSTKRKAFAAPKPSRIKRLKLVSCEGPICATTVVIGNLALLIQSISEKDTKGIIIHSLSIMLYILTQLRTFVRTKASKFRLVSILVMVGYPLWLHLHMKKNHSSYDERAFVSRYIRKAWNWAASNGFLHAVAQVM